MMVNIAMRSAFFFNLILEKIRKKHKKQFDVFQCIVRTTLVQSFSIYFSYTLYIEIGSITPPRD